MSNCNDSLLVSTRTFLNAQLAAMNYKKQKSDAFVALTAATQARDSKYPSGSAGIDTKYAAGWYVDPATPNIVEVNGSPFDCNQNNGPAFPYSCCYASSAAQSKCCSCKQKYSCNTTGICLGMCGGTGTTCTNGALSVNRFQSQIDSEKADLANMNNSITQLKANYNAVASPVSATLVDTTCCIDKINSGVSATTVLFNQYTGQCTNTSVTAANALRASRTTARAPGTTARALDAPVVQGPVVQGPTTLATPVVSHSCNFNPGPEVQNALANTNPSTLKTLLGVFGR